MAATVSCAVCRIEQSKPRWGPFEVPRAKVRDRGEGRRGENPLHLVDPAEVGTADEEPRCAVAGSLPAWGIDRRLPGSPRPLLGKDAPNLSPAVISRLTAEWQADYDAWQKRDLSARRYVYVGRMGSTCRPEWKKTPNACWC